MGVERQPPVMYLIREIPHGEKIPVSCAHGYDHGGGGVKWGDKVTLLTPEPDPETTNQRRQVETHCPKKGELQPHGGWTTFIDAGLYLSRLSRPRGLCTRFAACAQQFLSSTVHRRQIRDWGVGSIPA